MKTSLPLVLIAVMTVTIVLLALPEKPAPGAAIGTIAPKTEIVERGAACGTLEQLLDMAALLHTGECVRVREGGEARLDFGDGLQLNLFNDTLARDVRSESAPGIPLDVQMYLEEGGFTGHLTAEGGKAAFRTPGGVEITVLGTEFFVVYDPANRRTTVGNWSGTVVVAVDGSLIQLPVGTAVRLLAGQPPSSLRSLTKSRAEFDAVARERLSPIEAAAEVVATAPTIQLSPSEGRPGTLVTVTGEGWQPRDTVFVGLDDPSDGPASQVDPSAVTIAATVDEEGNFVAAFTVPSDTRWTSLQSVSVMAQAVAAGETASAEFRIAATPEPSSTPTPAPTDTPTPSLTNTPSPTPTPCTPRWDWPVYFVQPGDTLFSIARRTGSTVAELMLANCLVNDRIYVGQPLYVPRLPPTPTHTPTATLTPTPTPTPTPTHTSTPTPTFTPTFTPTRVIGTVRGRVLWNEQPVAGATAYATDLYGFNSTRYGSAVTGRDGLFSIPGVPEGAGYLYVFGNQPEFWLAAVTPFQIVSGGVTDAQDTYLCKGFDPISPEDNEYVYTSRPILRWSAYPDAADYAVRVLPEGGSVFVWSRGDSDARIKETQVQVDVDLSLGRYTWRVDAFNAAGHIIGCSFYPRRFTVAEPIGN